MVRRDDWAVPDKGSPGPLTAISDNIEDRSQIETPARSYLCPCRPRFTLRDGELD